MRMIAPARLAVAWLTMFLVGTELFVFSPLLPVLVAEYHVTPGLAGLSVTIFSLAYMVSAPLFGYFSDRIGRRRVLVCSLLAFALANILTAGAANLPSLLVVRLFAGAAAAGVSPSIYALVGGAAPPERRASWLALVVSGLLVSLAIGASAGGLVAAVFGGPSVFLALAGLSLVLVWVNRWVWQCEDDRAAAGRDATAPGPLGAAVLARRLIPMVVEHGPLQRLHLPRSRPRVCRLFDRADRRSHPLIRLRCNCRGSRRRPRGRSARCQLYREREPRRPVRLPAAAPAGARRGQPRRARPRRELGCCTAVLSGPASRSGK